MIIWPVAANKIYKHVKPNGQTVYSDEPEAGAEEVDLPPIQTYTSPKPAAAATDEIPQDNNYTTTAGTHNYQMVFSAPENDQVFTVAHESIKVKIFVEPELTKTDRIKLFMDDKPVSNLQSNTEFTLKNLARGSHKLVAKVFPKSGIGEAKGRTEPIIIHIQRNIVNGSSPFSAPKAPAFGAP